MVTGAVSGEVQRRSMMSYNALVGSSENFMGSEARTVMGCGETGRTGDG